MMINKNKVLILGIFFLSVVGFSQESKLSLSINNPISIGAPIFRDNFGPIVDLGLKYRYKKYANFSVGLILNVEYYESRRSFDLIGNSVFSSFKPGFFAELPSIKTSLLRTYFGITYAGITASSSNGDNSSGHGINGIVGVHCKVYGSVHINLQYDYTKVISANTFITSLGREFNVMKVGMEYIF